MRSNALSRTFCWTFLFVLFTECWPYHLANPNDQLHIFIYLYTCIPITQIHLSLYLYSYSFTCIPITQIHLPVYLYSYSFTCTVYTFIVLSLLYIIKCIPSTGPVIVSSKSTIVCLKFKKSSSHLVHLKYNKLIYLLYSFESKKIVYHWYIVNRTLV